MSEEPLRRRKTAFVCAAFVIALLTAHALFVPAYEGPDETGHLSRVFDFIDRPVMTALRGGPMDPAIVADFHARCGPTAHRVFGCTPSDKKPTRFNLLRRNKIDNFAAPTEIRNPENNQPPGFYLFAGFSLRIAEHFLPLRSPGSRLLAVRLLCVGLVGVGIVFFARTAAFRDSALLPFSFLTLLALPGAAESLARCANDAAVFTWCCLILWTLQRRTPDVAVFLLLAVGPLLKPTALPIAAFAVCLLWRQGERRKAVVGLTAALSVFPLQALRGWKWGGTYELNRPALALTEGPAGVIVGFGRSIYAFVKTTAWLGGWSFFRAPRLLLVAYLALGLCLLAAVRFRSHKEWIPHAAGLALAMTGFMVFALANRRFFGVWGGVGGWYVWGWFPWLITAGFDLLTLRPVTARLLFSATVILVVATSLIYYWTAAGIYA